MTPLVPSGPNDVVVLPAKGNVDFPLTTFYHWPHFSGNLTEKGSRVDQGVDFEVINGPTMFRKADVVQSEKEQVKFLLKVSSF